MLFNRGCGSCTVTVSHFDHSQRKMEYMSINSCLAPLVTLQGRHVITVEGLGNCKAPHPVQSVLANAHASQCGYCTPGIVMSLYTQLKNKPQSTTVDIEDTFDGNLCRCTGYRPILEGAQTFACENVCGATKDIEDLYQVSLRHLELNFQCG